jgi:hypothetical protein
VEGEAEDRIVATVVHSGAHGATCPLRRCPRVGMLIEPLGRAGRAGRTGRTGEHFGQKMFVRLGGARGRRPGTCGGCPIVPRFLVDRIARRY